MARIGSGEARNSVLVVKLEGKRTFGRPGCKWGDNMIMDLQEVEWVCTGWINLAQDWNRWRDFVNAVINLGVPWIFRAFSSVVRQMPG